MNCPMCYSDMVLVTDGYYCLKCRYTLRSAKPQTANVENARCPKCGMAVKKLGTSYYCKSCLNLVNPIDSSSKTPRQGVQTMNQVKQNATLKPNKTNQTNSQVVKNSTSKAKRQTDNKNENSTQLNVADYVANIQKEIQELQQDALKVNIVNAGRMNHGKSSMLNSLLDRDEFAAADVRTTVTKKKVEYKNSACFIDTPGLDAMDNDTEEAFNAYKKANMVLFVHNPTIGELHREEIDSIKKIMNLFPEKDYFWKHFCLVISFIDAFDNQKDLETIITRVKTQISNELGGKDYSVFKISNSRYKKGQASGKQGMVKASGILELRSFIDTSITHWQQEAEALAVEKIKSRKQEAIAVLTALKKNVAESVTAKNEANRARVQRVLEPLKRQLASINDNEKEIRRVNTEVNSLTRQISSAEAKHESEFYDYR